MRTVAWLAPLLAACSIRFADPGPSGGALPPPAPPEPPVYADPPDAPGPRSIDYEIGEMAASISAQVDGDVLHVYAALLHQNVAGVDLHVRLVTGDYFTAKVGGAELALLEEPDPGESPVSTKVYRYTATFPAPADAANVVVAFRRAVGRAGAPLSQVTLPPDFHFVDSPTQARAGDVLSLAIAPSDKSDPSATATLTADCIDGDHTVTLAVQQEGPLRATVAELPLVSGATGCDGTLALQRNAYGQVDSAFRRGALDAIWTMDGSRQHTVPIHITR